MERMWWGKTGSEKISFNSIVACHPCAGTMLIFSVSFQFCKPRRRVRTQILSCKLAGRFWSTYLRLLGVEMLADRLTRSLDQQSQDTLAEWLRRRPAKPMCSARVGSNPTGVVYILFFRVYMFTDVQCSIYVCIYINVYTCVFDLLWCARQYALVASMNQPWTRRPFGLVVWFSLRVREVPGSIPGTAPYICGWFWNNECLSSEGTTNQFDYLLIAMGLVQWRIECLSNTRTNACLMMERWTNLITYS